jgi:hypothetical protein
VKSGMSLGPLVTRVYRYKNPSKLFYCPLCRTERAMLYSPRLGQRQYIQIAISTLFLNLLLYPVMGFRALFLGFLVWGSYEMGVRVLFKREVPCPHCGFDATTYKRDVKSSRKEVELFWQNQQEQAEVSS